jgi:hypothetical protein
MEWYHLKKQIVERKNASVDHQSAEVFSIDGPFTGAFG